MIEGCSNFPSHTVFNIAKQENGEKLGRRGYEEIQTGVFVAEKDAFSYALEQCLEAIPEGTGMHECQWTQEFKNMLVEWFYSGNWVRVD